MKRILSLILTLVLVFGAFAMHPATISLADTPPYGDGNEDNQVNATDALMALKITVGKLTVSDTIYEYLDVDDSTKVDATDALMILKYVVGKLAAFPADKGHTEQPDDPSSDSSSNVSSGSGNNNNNGQPPKNPLDDMTMEDVLDSLDGEVSASEIKDYYSVHSNGGLIYNPLSREMDQAEKTKYNASKKATGTLTMKDGSVLTYSVPTDVTAYDMIPVEYSVNNKGTSPVYVEATTFEDVDGSYYDLCLPGQVKLQFDYLGYVTANNNKANRPSHDRRFTGDKPGTKYPQYETGDLVKSDTAPSGKPLWFKFKITNTGNTILEGDGNGTFCFEPFLDNKTTGKTTSHTNIYTRLTEDLYPGQSVEMYFYFGSSSGMSLSAGEYDVRIRCLVRNEQSAPDWGTKIWGGYVYGTASKAITVAETPTITTKSKASYTVNRSTPTRSTWLHTYEEFTTSYDAWQVPSALKANQKHTLWVQPAAWSDRVVLKFMRGNDMNMVSATIPLKVETDSLSINLNEYANNFIITDEGTKYPAMASQSMCDMRVNDSNSPYANEAQLDELLDMKECGINLVTTTEAFNVNQGNTTISNNNDANLFVSDVLRKLGMRMEGYTGYSYYSDTTISTAFWLTRDPAFSGGFSGFSTPMIDHANALRGMYQFARWGDNFYIDGQNRVIFNTEDTRGWMRIDYNARQTTTAGTIANFQDWLKEKYGTIDKLNAAWSDRTSDFYYTSFEEIDPTEGTTKDAYNHPWDVYYGTSALLGEWSKGLTDWDIYRTLERVNGYKNTLAAFNDITLATSRPLSGAVSLPNASMGIRTEGANMTGIVDPNTPNSHLRHAYYSQRRCAIIPEILSKSDTVSMHSDYVTLPYSVAELEELVASSTAIGITSMPLLQSNRMREIAINSKYGDDYTFHYNLSGSNTKGAYINTQVSVFEAFRAIYENGGIPGVLWEDYLCDGYITETQQKEMKFYSSKIAEMMSTDEAKAWATTNVPNVEETLGKSLGKYSYNEEYIQSEVDAAIKRRANQQ